MDSDESSHIESGFYYRAEMINDNENDNGKDNIISAWFYFLRESTCPVTAAAGFLPTASGTQDLGNSFLQYGPPSRWVTYTSIFE